MYDFFWRVRELAMRAPGPLRTLLRLICRTMEYVGGATIPLTAQFAGKPCLPHGIHGVFISAGAKIGRNCVIFQHVTIGSNTLPGSKGAGAPQIGDDCYIGAGAKIIGGVKVGDNVRIGANAVVFRDVPDNSVVTAGEQVVRQGRHADNRFYQHRKGAWVYYEDGEWKPATDGSPTSCADALSEGAAGSGAGPVRNAALAPQPGPPARQTIAELFPRAAASELGEQQREPGQGGDGRQAGEAVAGDQHQIPL